MSFFTKSLSIFFFAPLLGALILLAAVGNLYFSFF